MSTRSFLALLGTLILTASHAQHVSMREYDWEAKPVLADSLRTGAKEDVLTQRHVIAQFDDTGGDLAYYELFHLQRFLHDDAAVDASKTIELGTGHIEKMIRLKARSIDPDGTVHELGPDAFKNSSDERDGSAGVRFAFENLKPGSMIEYIMLSQQQGDIQGDLTRLQFGIPVAHERYELMVPRGWKFSFKGYNGCPMPEVDSTLTGITRYHIELNNLPGIEDERSAEAARYRMYIVARIDAIPDRGLRDISSYVSATRNYHRSLYPELENKTKKSLQKALKEMGLAYARDEEDRIRTLDHHIRGNYRMAEVGGGKLSDLDEILKTGNCSKFGFQKLYANLLREAGIEHQVVVTSDRTDSPFDPTFEAHNYLRNVSFYFPGIDKYIDPVEFGLGLGYMAPENMGTHGLFIRNLDVNGIWTGVGTVKRIAELPAESTRHDLEVTITPSADGSESTVEFENQLTGYYARFIQNFYTYMKEEQQSEFLDAQLKHFMEGSTTHQVDVENAEQRLFGVKPFTLKGKVTTSAFNNRAGEDVLLLVGELIGPQMEMYVEKQRKLPVDEDFNRYYDRRITVRIPDGWACDDITSLEIHKTLELDGIVVAEFKSTAARSGDNITVQAIEYYRTNHVPLEQFEAYRAVINAAADFNKRALLLHPVKN
ncbi:MAG: DUF3857 domain-containing protein [Flavobacteriales bacterium]|nr:DUF3857 domain-containing protein [Flavobacteriales bacterium]